ncbi:MAG: septum formation initiator family protein [Candidatus Lumbricidophila eiseniae]|uniref:Septum formation initiator family protein n=1 Tax=Candidatus Lumbricidiphila eiseniae TaxID=1969409 RepID=A0A2A6FQF3_9MICO|nr:MAG: septum formation initiator family protein [Candidatus Lumbricidophila eiseniae]
MTPLTGSVTERDIQIVSAQLGRPARNVIAVPARCVCGAPAVVTTAPRLADGTPFPTLYYLTHPAATAEMSRLEAAQFMTECTELLESDPDIAVAYRAAHRSYLAEREAVAVVPELAQTSAGGMPVRVKCLHALCAHALAAGPGVNPIGDLALARSRWTPSVCQCPEYPPVGESEGGGVSVCQCAGSGSCR